MIDLEQYVLQLREMYSWDDFLAYATARDAEHADQLRDTRNALANLLTVAKKQREDLAAAERTIEQLGLDAAAIAGRLDRAVTLLRKNSGRCIFGETERCETWMPTDPSASVCPPCEVRAFLASLASPSQPGPAKHLDHDFEGADPNVCEYPYSMGVCGRPQNAHVPIIPENAGTTCSACNGKGGFDPFGVPMEGQANPAYQCGTCEGRGTK